MKAKLYKVKPPKGCPLAKAPQATSDEAANQSQSLPDKLEPLHLRAPARLVGEGFRCWVKGIETSDPCYYDMCCQRYIQALGPVSGIVLTTRLGQWVEAIDQQRRRAIRVYEPDALGFSRDEVVAISMVAASQHGNCPALRACLYAMTENSDIGLSQVATDDFAEGLISAGQILGENQMADPLAAMAAAQAGHGH